eukprot:gene10652-12331_t
MEQGGMCQGLGLAEIPQDPPGRPGMCQGLGVAETPQEPSGCPGLACLGVAETPQDPPGRPSLACLGLAEAPQGDMMRQDDSEPGRGYSSLVRGHSSLRRAYSEAMEEDTVQIELGMGGQVAVRVVVHCDESSGSLIFALLVAPAVGVDGGVDGAIDAGVVSGLLETGMDGGVRGAAADTGVIISAAGVDTAGVGVHSGVLDTGVDGGVRGAPADAGVPGSAAVGGGVVTGGSEDGSATLPTSVTSTESVDASDVGMHGGVLDTGVDGGVRGAPADAGVPDSAAVDGGVGTVGGEDGSAILPTSVTITESVDAPGGGVHGGVLDGGVHDGVGGAPADAGVLGGAASFDASGVGVHGGVLDTRVDGDVHVATADAGVPDSAAVDGGVGTVGGEEGSPILPMPVAGAEEEAVLQCISEAQLFGVLLMPCRTVVQGGFPLNGTYFQTNEVFVDQQTMDRPMAIPGDMLCDMAKPATASNTFNWAMVYFGAATSSITREMNMAEVAFVFNQASICVRAFDCVSETDDLISETVDLMPTFLTPRAADAGLPHPSETDDLMRAFLSPRAADAGLPQSSSCRSQKPMIQSQKLMI